MSIFSLLLFFYFFLVLFVVCVPKKVFLALVVFAEKEDIEVGNGKPFYIIGFCICICMGRDGERQREAWRFLASFSSDLQKKKEGDSCRGPPPGIWLGGLMDLCCYEWSIEMSEKK